MSLPPPRRTLNLRPGARPPRIGPPARPAPRRGRTFWLVAWVLAAWVLILAVLIDPRSLLALWPVLAMLAVLHPKPR